MWLYCALSGQTELDSSSSDSEIQCQSQSVEGKLKLEAVVPVGWESSRAVEPKHRCRSVELRANLTAAAWEIGCSHGVHPELL
ncbi:hypothetical protein Q5P01_005573 [Channa striata]|uniref:Uncharacterized protein n=1 Tax=Channa striata TaxID=64152 RepID=A0AA88SYN3_CHASR|nr:hypothetical protein Q5P01_005573 [Channa striata]